MLSRIQVAEKIGVSPQTIDKWTRAGKIPYFNLNGIKRFDEKIIDSWIQKRMVKSKSVA
jgi:predicted site-specific integrase-resolvase